jgi:hypothetical protein
MIGQSLVRLTNQSIGKLQLIRLRSTVVKTSRPTEIMTHYDLTFDRHLFEIVQLMNSGPAHGPAMSSESDFSLLKVIKQAS